MGSTVKLVNHSFIVGIGSSFAAADGTVNPSGVLFHVFHTTSSIHRNRWGLRRREAGLRRCRLSKCPGIRLWTGSRGSS